MSRADEHARDEDEFPKKHDPGCLTGHESGRQKGKPGYVTEKSCNYRWQAFKQALAESRLYNGKAPAGQTIPQVVFGSGGKDRKRKVSKSTDWDMADPGVNFRTQCNKPSGTKRTISSRMVNSGIPLVRWARETGQHGIGGSSGAASWRKAIT